MGEATGKAGGSRRTWRVDLGGSTRLRSRLGRTTRWAAATPVTPPVGAGGEIGHVLVTADSISWLRRFLAEPAGATRVRQVTVQVRDWRPPRPEWAGRLGPLPGAYRQQVTLPRRSGTACVSVELKAAVALHDVLVAVLAALAPIRPLPRPASADVIALGAAPPWLAPSANHVAWSGPLPPNEEIRAHDLVLAADPGGVPSDPLLAAAVVAADRTGARVDDRTPAVLIDPAVANPIGRDISTTATAPGAALLLDADSTRAGWRLVGAGDRVLARGPLADVPLRADQLRAVAKIGKLRCAGLAGRAPDAEAALLAQLAATGVVLEVPELPPAVAGRLAAPLREVLAEPLPGVGADPLDWEIRAARQLRAALRGHGGAFALGEVVAGTFTGLAAPPSVSAILVTRRPEYVPDAVRYIAGQTYPELEIVLCLHGIEADDELRAKLADCGRPLEIFTAPPTLSFGEVMGAATARARGSLVTKFDDDDVYGPEHVWDLVLAREFSGATLVGKAAEFVYLQTLGVTVRRRAVPPETYGPPVAGGTMLMSRGDLEDVGGWRPVPRSVDRGLMDRVLRAGGLIYRTHPLGYIYERRAGGHTWDAGLDYFLRRSGQQWHGMPVNDEFGTTGRERVS
ncbi:glycosyltransferase [Micromonospora sp. NPDC049559]|uniref:glycosyltransferase n=1 Tax=Micromonospora sp. NPDC049559 TaxID=3155923 RepID=UPI003445C69B